MGIAFLLMAFLPLVFLPDMLDTSDGSEDDQAPPAPPQPIGGDPVSLLDDPGQGADNTEEIVLAPNDEDDLPDDGTQNPDVQDILLPVIEDDMQTPSDGNEGNVLLPVDQIASDADTIWINFDDDAGLGYSEIEGFQPAQDILHVLIAPDSVVDELDVSVTVADNGLDALVYVEQQLVAILKGAPEATIADVIVEIGVIAA